MVLEGNCPQCGYNYAGWALRHRQHQTCPKCGAELKITNGGQMFIKPNNSSMFKKRIIDLLKTPILPNHGKKNEYNQDSN